MSTGSYDEYSNLVRDPPSTPASLAGGAVGPSSASAQGLDDVFDFNTLASVTGGSRREEDDDGQADQGAGEGTSSSSSSSFPFPTSSSSGGRGTSKSGSPFKKSKAPKGLGFLLKARDKSRSKSPAFSKHKKAKSKKRGEDDDDDFGFDLDPGRTNSGNGENVDDTVKAKSEHWQAFQQMQDRIKQNVLKTQSTIGKLSAGRISPSGRISPRKGRLDEEESVEEADGQDANINSLLIPTQEDSNFDSQQDSALTITSEATASYDFTQEAFSPLPSLTDPVKIRSNPFLNPEISVSTPSAYQTSHPKPSHNFAMDAFDSGVDVGSANSSSKTKSAVEEFDLLGLNSDPPPAPTTNHHGGTSGRSSACEDLLGLDDFMSQPASRDMSQDNLQDWLGGYGSSQSSAQSSLCPSPVHFDIDMLTSQGRLAPDSTAVSDLARSLVDDFLQWGAGNAASDDATGLQPSKNLSKNPFACDDAGGLDDLMGGGAVPHTVHSAFNPFATIVEPDDVDFMDGGAGGTSGGIDLLGGGGGADVTGGFFDSSDANQTQPMGNGFFSQQQPQPQAPAAVFDPFAPVTETPADVALDPFLDINANATVSTLPFDSGPAPTITTSTAADPFSTSPPQPQPVVTQSTQPSQNQPPQPPPPAGPAQPTKKPSHRKHSNPFHITEDDFVDGFINFDDDFFASRGIFHAAKPKDLDSIWGTASGGGDGGGGDDDTASAWGTPGGVSAPAPADNPFQDDAFTAVNVTKSSANQDNFCDTMAAPQPINPFLTASFENIAAAQIQANPLAPDNPFAEMLKDGAPSAAAPAPESLDAFLGESAAASSATTSGNVGDIDFDPFSPKPSTQGQAEPLGGSNIALGGDLFGDAFGVPQQASKEVASSAVNGENQTGNLLDDALFGGTAPSQPATVVSGNAADGQSNADLFGDAFSVGNAVGGSAEPPSTAEDGADDDDDDFFSPKIKLDIKEKSAVQAQSDAAKGPVPMLPPPPKTPKSPQTMPQRENPFDKASPPEENFASFAEVEEELKKKAEEEAAAKAAEEGDKEKRDRDRLKSVTSEDSTPEEDEGPMEPLEPFRKLEDIERESWPLMVRQPSKKKLAGNRFWKMAYLKVGTNKDGPVLRLFMEEKDKDPFQELPLQPCYSISDISMQQYDQFGKIHTVKLQYVFYRERVGLRPERLTPSSLVRRPKPNMILDHAPQVSELLKLGSLDLPLLQSLVWALEDNLMRLHCRRDRTLTYTKDEVQAEVWDEYVAEIDKDGHVASQKARVRIFFLAFLTGMPACELGISDRRRKGKEVVGRHDIIPVRTEDWIRIEEPEFHHVVDMETYNRTHNIRFHPLDACQFELVRFRVRPRENRELPLQLRVQQSLKGLHFEVRVDLLVTGYHAFSKKCGQFPCEDIEVRIGIPEPWIYYFRYEKRFGYGSLKAIARKPGRIKGLERITMMAQGLLTPALMEASVGTAKYEHLYRAVVWRIPRLPERNHGAYKNHVFVLHLGLGKHDEIPDSLTETAYVNFTMPASTVSKAQVRSISVDTQEPPEKWVRYIARYNYTVEIDSVMEPIGSAADEAAEGGVNSKGDEEEE